MVAPVQVLPFFTGQEAPAQVDRGTGHLWPSWARLTPVQELTLSGDGDPELSPSQTASGRVQPGSTVAALRAEAMVVTAAGETLPSAGTMERGHVREPSPGRGSLTRSCSSPPCTPPVASAAFAPSPGQKQGFCPGCLTWTSRAGSRACVLLGWSMAVDGQGLPRGAEERDGSCAPSLRSPANPNSSSRWQVTVGMHSNIAFISALPKYLELLKAKSNSRGQVAHYS